MSKISPEGGVYQAGTLSGNPVAMSAGFAQLSECLKPNFYKKLESKTQKLLSGLSQFKNNNFKVFSVGSIFWIAFTDKDKIQTAEEIDADSMQHFRSLYHKLLEKGIYMGPSGYEVGFMSEAHTDEDITATIKAFSEAL
jgi:glutamate-1-semialdehyde 2,1-aminomutase